MAYEIQETQNMPFFGNEKGNFKTRAAEKIRNKWKMNTCEGEGEDAIMRGEKGKKRKVKE